MGRFLGFLLFFLGLFISVAIADWNILNLKTKNGLNMSLKNYCESWRMNVELHNIQNFQVVPQECVSHIGKYVTSTQYQVDSERTIEECLVYLSTGCTLNKDGIDVWLFDIDDTLLSTVGEQLNLTSLEEWMRQGKAPVLEYSLKLFNELKSRGVQIILVSSRREHLRSATIDNLVDVGYHGWTSLILRGPEDELDGVQKFKANVRKQLIGDGYRIWGILGDQYSSFEGLPSVKRTFKLPNPLYHVA
ncbi:hypothetical protein P3X46_027484 [Hevea brasiliensis]|uniref:Acid phosphatase n=1 Tax=Hevea brasiliensis TaxID=3981 RepID=A0ABQ9L006_HEVBR|nr:hypothetical protein P3X46_027484 [Hevea brasiliensis]